jgi:AcrR family transcriptional regulator
MAGVNEPRRPHFAKLPSGRHGLPRDVVTADQRGRLLASAVYVAATDGYSEMTVDDVIKVAEISRKTFYEHFKDKEDCFLAAFDDVLERARAGARSDLASVARKPWPRLVRAQLAWGLGALDANPGEALVLLVEVLSAGPKARERRADALAELAHLFEPGYAVAPAQAAIPPSMPIAIAGGLDELLRRRAAEDDAAPLAALLPDLHYCALAPFLGAARAARIAAAG